MLLLGLRGCMIRWSALTAAAKCSGDERTWKLLNNPEPAGHQCRLLAGSASPQPRQEVDRRRQGLASKRLLFAAVVTLRSWSVTTGPDRRLTQSL